MRSPDLSCECALIILFSYIISPLYAIGFIFFDNLGEIGAEEISSGG